MGEAGWADRQEGRMASFSPQLWGSQVTAGSLQGSLQGSSQNELTLT